MKDLQAQHSKNLANAEFATKGLEQQNAFLTDKTSKLEEKERVALQTIENMTRERAALDEKVSYLISAKESLEAKERQLADINAEISSKEKVCQVQLDYKTKVSSVLLFDRFLLLFDF